MLSYSVQVFKNDVYMFLSTEKVVILKSPDGFSESKLKKTIETKILKKSEKDEEV